MEKRPAKLIFFILGLLIIVFLFELIYYFNLKLKNKAQLTPDQQKKQQQMIQTYGQFQEAARTLQDKIPQISAIPTDCYVLNINPNLGAQTKTIINNDQALFDFDYDGTIKEIVEDKQDRCQYWKIKLQIRRSTNEYDYLLPTDLLLTNKSSGDISPELFTKFIGQEIQIRLRYRQLDNNKWQLLEWNFLRFFI